MRRVGNVTAEHFDAPLLDGARTGDQREKTGLADAVRPDESDHPPRWYVERNGLEGLGLAIRQPHRFEPRDRRVHSSSLPLRLDGHSA